MKVMWMVILIGLVSLRAVAGEQYFCQSLDSSLVASLDLDERIVQRPKSVEVCTGGYYGDSERTCYIDNFIEEARLASVEILDRSGSRTFQRLEVYRYLRSGQAPRKTFNGSASIANSAYKELSISDSAERYILFISTAARSFMLRCQ